MNEFKILNNPKQASYFDESNCEKDDEEYYQYTHFEDYVKDAFLKELSKHSEKKKQMGYSKKRDCDYISLILILHESGDGCFLGHTVKSTCLIKKNGKIKDSNNNSDIYDERGHSIGAIYHQLPDGKLVEYMLEKSYENQLDHIYENIIKIRSYHELNEELPIKNTLLANKKLKI